MINHKNKKRLLAVMISGFVILAAMASPALGATYNLRARQTTMVMPDGETITMWGYALWRYNIGNGWVQGDRITKVPGPKLMVPQGQRLRVNLVNTLSVPVSITIPGQMENSPTLVRNADGRIRSFTREAPARQGGANGRARYTWNNLKPGTYLYHSGTHPAVQVQMGLYGGVTKNWRDAGPTRVYSGVPYDEEVMVIYSEIDPLLHQAVADGTYGTEAYPSTIDYKPKYFLINGVAGDSLNPVAMIDPGSRVLLRLLNAGLKDHAPEILGTHVSLVAEDGNLYPYPKNQYSLFLPAGKTLDAVFTPPNSAAGEKYSIFDRRAYRSNADGVSGAMHAFITVNQN